MYHWRDGKFIQNFTWKTEERRPLAERLGVDESIILKLANSMEMSPS
jgi:hypothetical protein